MSYQVYKLIHLYSLVIVCVCLAANAFSDKPMKLTKIGAMVGGLLLFVAGMGLLARGGYPHGEPWPLWVKTKIALWLILAAGGPVSAKKFPNSKKQVLAFFTVLILMAVSLVILRPF